jgi:hypothetical protein
MTSSRQFGFVTIETTVKIYTRAFARMHRHPVEHLELVRFPSVPNCLAPKTSRYANLISGLGKRACSSDG